MNFTLNKLVLPGEKWYRFFLLFTRNFPKYNFPKFSWEKFEKKKFYLPFPTCIFDKKIVIYRLFSKIKPYGFVFKIVFTE